MKCVMLSIRPKYCELIANGKKTVEVRKTKPKIDVPFKCYIYCTQGKLKDLGIIGETMYRKRMKVIGEFVCDKIVEFENSWFDPAFAETSNLSCVGFEELALYLGGKEVGYGWHITDLVIYDKPKELSEFRKICQSDYCHTCDYAVKKNGYLVDCDRSVKRPQQSWCYCEELLPPLVEPKGKTITIPKWEYKE